MDSWVQWFWRGRMRMALAAALALGTAFGDNGPNHRAQQQPPIQLGVSGSNINDINAQFCCVGTLGAMVRKTVNGEEVRYILSNNHVLARSNGAAIGEEIIHRGYVDTVPPCSNNGTFTVATLSEFVPLNFAGGNNTVDAAIAAIVPGTVANNGFIMDVGPINNFPLNPAVGMPVRKSGRTSGLTTGTVSEVSSTVVVSGYGPNCGFPQFTARFVNQFRITPGTFLSGGDSGSLVVRVATLSSGTTVRLPVGLAFAGSSTSAIANPISAVIAAFGVSFGAGAPTPEEAAAAAQLQMSDPRITAAARVKDRYEDALLRLPEVVGHGIGYARDGSGEVVIRLFLRRLTDAARAAAPGNLENIRVELEETGEFRAVPACGPCAKSAPCAKAE